MAGRVPQRRKNRHTGIMFTNAVYYPSNAVYDGYTPAQLDYRCVNLVYYAFASVCPNGLVMLSDEKADLMVSCDNTNGALRSMQQLKQQNEHLQVLLSVGGDQSDLIFPEVAADPGRRDAFARSVYEFMEASGLDGIDINWIYPADAQQTTDFLALLAHTRRVLPADRYYLTTTLPASLDVLQRLNVRRIAEHVDLLNIAAYNLYGPWSAVCGHHAQLYAIGRDEAGYAGGASGASAVQYLMAHGVSSEKILLGVPLFGRSFLATAGPGHPFGGIGNGTSGGGGIGTYAFYELPLPGTMEQVDRRVMGALCIGADGEFVTYDNPETVKAKAEFCKQKSLGGLFYWAAPFDDRDRCRSLVAAGYRALHEVELME